MLDLIQYWYWYSHTNSWEKAEKVREGLEGCDGGLNLI